MTERTVWDKLGHDEVEVLRSWCNFLSPPIKNLSCCSGTNLLNMLQNTISKPIATTWHPNPTRFCLQACLDRVIKRTVFYEQEEDFVLFSAGGINARIGYSNCTRSMMASWIEIWHHDYCIEGEGCDCRNDGGRVFGKFTRIRWAMTGKGKCAFSCMVY